MRNFDLKIKNSIKTKELVEKSIQVIIENQHKSGSFPASPSFPQFRYCWLRDGMFTAQAAMIVGHEDKTKKFYLWVHNTILKHAQTIQNLKTKIDNGGSLSSADFLPARFTMDGDLEVNETGEEPFFFSKWPEIYSLTGMDSGKDWPNFQTDCYGAWLWGLVDFVKHTGDMEFFESCKESIDLTIEYLKLTWEMPCFDPWEEYGAERNIASLGCICGGLQAVNEFYKNDELVIFIEEIRNVLLNSTDEDGAFPKFIGGASIDANSLWLTIPYNVFDVKHPAIINTVKKIEEKLLVNGGVKRYLEDVYYGGGKWIILTCWLGMYYISIEKYDQARELLDWVENHTEVGNNFPEQILEDLNFPEFKDEWESKWWGESPAPLLWSHAMYLIFLKEYESNAQIKN